MTGKPERGGDWSVTTWKGSRRQQHREFHGLPFSRKLELVEQMGEMAAQFGGASRTAKAPAALREIPPPYGSQSDRGGT